MEKYWQVSLLVLAVVSVAVADVFLKRAALHGSLVLALKSPWLALAAGLYLLQVLLFTHFFVTDWKLSMVGSLQTVLYALVVVGAGWFIFQEPLSRTQWTGVVLAFAGAVLINLEI